MPNLAKITPVFSINPCMGFFSGFFEYKVHMSSISWNKSLLNLIKTCYWPQGQLKSEQHYILYLSKSACRSALLILGFFMWTDHLLHFSVPRLVWKGLQVWYPQ